MRERSLSPDPAIDHEEEVWWNENADTVEAIWAMAEPVREAIRTPYLDRARHFFLAGQTQQPARLLEVGCGSGWVGRMIADREHLQIIGLDIASEQIRLANENAATAGLSEVCEYRCQNLADFAARDAQSVSCVLIHAILHHLSWQEIRSVLAQLKVLGSGTRIFIYEPVYLADPAAPMEETPRSRHARFMAGLPAQAMRIFQTIFRPARDQELLARVNTLVADAQRQGRILSPKEVVFREPEILGALEEIGKVTERYVCNYTTLPMAQFATSIKNKALQRLFCATVLPLAAYVDRWLFDSRAIPLVTRDYVFMGYHCVVS